MGTEKTCVSKRLDITSSKFVNHSSFKSQHNGGVYRVEAPMTDQLRYFMHDMEKYKVAEFYHV